MSSCIVLRSEEKSPRKPQCWQTVSFLLWLKRTWWPSTWSRIVSVASTWPASASSMWTIPRWHQLWRNGQWRGRSRLNRTRACWRASWRYGQWNPLPPTDSWLFSCWNSIERITQNTLSRIVLRKNIELNPTELLHQPESFSNTFNYSRFLKCLAPSAFPLLNFFFKFPVSSPL